MFVYYIYIEIRYSGNFVDGFILGLVKLYYIFFDLFGNICKCRYYVFISCIILWVKLLFYNKYVICFSWFLCFYCIGKIFDYYMILNL